MKSKLKAWDVANYLEELYDMHVSNRLDGIFDDARNKIICLKEWGMIK